MVPLGAQMTQQSAHFEQNQHVQKHEASGLMMYVHTQAAELK